tara:strand:+ start:1027 stop:1638 length:612 start_codon:yes stop_codon:yes gene_type:complete
MSEVCKDAILELFEFNNKSVLCLVNDDEYISGLIKRGANLSFLREKKEFKKSPSDEEQYLVTLNQCSDIFVKKGQINHIDDVSNHNFDYLIANSLINERLIRNYIPIAEYSLIIHKNTIKNYKKLSTIKNLNKDFHFISYSVSPSLEKIKLIIPNQIDVPIERYWSLSGPNLIKTFGLVIEWIFISIKFLRITFSDRLIIIKC